MNKRIIVLFIVFLGAVIQEGGAVELKTDWGVIDIHGFISQGYLKSDTNNFYAETEDGTFQFNEFSINFSTDLTERLHAGLQLFSRDLGVVGNNQIGFDWAYADYRWKDWWGFRVGRIKLPLGLYNETRDIDMLRPSIFLPTGIYYENGREAFKAQQGIGIYGYIDLKALGNMNYQIQGGGTDLDVNGGMARYVEEHVGLDVGNFNVERNIGGSLEWNTPLENLRLAASMYFFKLKANGNLSRKNRWVPQAVPLGIPMTYTMDDTEVKTFSAEYTWRNLVLAAEYFSMRSNSIASVDPRLQYRYHIRNEGYYGSIAYRFTARFELGAYYSIFYPDTRDKDGKEIERWGTPKHRAWQKELVLTTRFDINNYWTFKLEGHFVNGTALLLALDNPDGLKKDSFLFAVKTTYNF